MALPEPYEVLDLQDKQSLTFSVLRYEEGEITIRPRHEPGPKVVNALRVYLPKPEEGTGRLYYDITAKRLRAQLLPFLQSETAKGRRFKITKYGVAPKAFFSVEVLP